MGRSDHTRHPVVKVAPGAPGQPAHDHRWAGQLRGAIGCSAAFAGLLPLVDWWAGSLTAWRGALWLALAIVLFVVLCPTHVSAGQGWLATRGLLRERRVRTDLLVSVCWMDGVAQRLVLRDALGGRVEIDPRVLTGNPELWHRVAEDSRAVRGAADRCPDAHGATPSPGATLHRLARRLDRDTALNVFKVSGLAS